jgi:hypothetical protein
MLPVPPVFNFQAATSGKPPASSADLTSAGRNRVASYSTVT